MNDDDIKRAVLADVLTRAEAEGFSASLLRSADTQSVFAGDIAGLIAFWSSEIDAALQTRLEGMDLASLSVRKRIRAGVLARLELLRPHKEAARKAAALPLIANVETLWRSADIIWRAAGDASTDFNFYSKRGILAGVISTTMIAWFGDESEDEAPTAAFLDARIENVLQFEKLKARFKDACAASSQT